MKKLHSVHVSWMFCCCCFLVNFYVEMYVMFSLSTCSCQVDPSEVIASLKARIQQDVVQLAKSNVPRCLICMVSWISVILIMKHLLSCFCFCK